MGPWRRPLRGSAIPADGARRAPGDTRLEQLEASTADELRARLDALAGNAYMLLSGVLSHGPGEARLRSVIDSVHDMLDHLRSCAGERGRTPGGGGPASWSGEDRERWLALADSLIERIGANQLIRDVVVDVRNGPRDSLAQVGVASVS